MNLWIEIVGWIGAVLMLGAYALVSFSRLSSASVGFQWMNAAGAACFVLNTWWHGAIPSMVVNAIWSLIGLITLCRMRRRNVA